MSKLPSVGRAVARGVFARRRGWSPGAPWPTLVAEAPGVSAEPGWLESLRATCGGLPPSWPQVFATRWHVVLLVDPSFPLRPAGLVHPRTRFAGAVDPGSPFDLRVSIEPPTAVENGLEFDLVTAVRQGGVPVWESRAATFSRTAAAPKGARGPEEVPVGRSVPVELPVDLGRRYARLSGDWNPVHLHPWLARLSGYRAPIAHGQWMVARALTALGLAPRSAEVRFVRPAFLGSPLRAVTDDRGAFALVGGDDKPRILGHLGATGV
ncbi:MAG: MaoC/PaaZ C-terminal domain-containing protein [Myxococcota bacterium]